LGKKQAQKKKNQKSKHSNPITAEGKKVNIIYTAGEK
jgi:hypothetical protein